jgi:exosortase A
VNTRPVMLRPAVFAERGVLLFLCVLGLTALVVTLYQGSFAGIFHLWIISTYRHCAFVFPLALYLLWRRRENLSTVAVAPSWIGVIALLGIVVAWQVGRATAVQALEHAAAIAAIPATVLAVLGTRFFAAAAFPLLFLLAAIPAGEAFIPPLMELTADISTTLLSLFGVPAFRDGMFISLAGGEFVIAELCAGLSYLFASVTLALLFACLSFRSATARALFIGATAVVFVIANGVRAFIVMVVASATNLRYFAGYDHVIFGMFFFFAVLALIFWVGMKFADPISAAAPVSRAPAPPDARCMVPLVTGVIAATLVLASGPTVRAFQGQVLASRPDDPALPSLQGCAGPASWSADWRPVLHGADADRRGSYRCGEVEANVLVATYFTQRQGKELVTSANLLVPNDWWTKDGRTDALPTLGTGRKLPINEVVRTDEHGSLLAWYWFSVNDHPVRSAYGVKLREAGSALTMRPAVSRVYVISATGPHDRIEPLRATVSKLAAELLHGRDGAV